MCSSGRFLGTVFAFSLTGLFCGAVSDGWKTIFFITGGGGLVWFVLWQLLTSHNPNTDPFISSRERNFIVSNIAINNNTPMGPVPWKSMLLSRPVWGCLVIHMTCDWLDFSVATNGPTYMHEVHNFNMAQNGLVSGLPHLCRFLSNPLVGYLCHALIKRNYLSVRAARIVFQTIATFGSSACLIGLGFVSSDQRPLAVFLLSFAFLLQSFSESSYQVNEIEIAPRYSGHIALMGNTLSGVAGILSPLITGAMTPNKTQEEWRNNFLIIVGLMVGALVLFLVFLDTEVQPWAKEDHKPTVFHVAKFGTEADEVKTHDSETDTK